MSLWNFLYYFIAHSSELLIKLQEQIYFSRNFGNWCYLHRRTFRDRR